MKTNRVYEPSGQPSYLIVSLDLNSTLPKNQAAPIENVISSDLYRISKLFGAFVSLWQKCPKAKGKL